MAFRSERPRVAFREEHLAGRPKLRRSWAMLRVHWKTGVAAIAFAAANTSAAEGSPAGHLRRSMESTMSEVSGLVVRTHGSHLKCRYGKHGKSKEEWHRHDRRATYPCAPPRLRTCNGLALRPLERARRSGPSSGQRTGTSPVFGPPASPGPKTGTSPIFGPPVCRAKKPPPPQARGGDE